jgi:hypothetical protein
MKGRRFLQFSLRTFLILLTVGCIWLGWKVERARRQREAVKAIEAIGGVVQYDWQGDIGSWAVWYSGGNYESRFVPADKVLRVPAWLRQSLGDDFFQRVNAVIFRSHQAEYFNHEGATVQRAFGNKIRAADIEAVIPLLQSLPDLQTISLEGDMTAIIGKEVENKLRVSFPQCRIVRECVVTYVKTAPNTEEALPRWPRPTKSDVFADGKPWPRLGSPRSSE